jgi:hypothetical protein
MLLVKRATQLQKWMHSLKAVSTLRGLYTVDVSISIGSSYSIEMGTQNRYHIKRYFDYTPGWGDDECRWYLARGPMFIQGD